MWPQVTGLSSVLSVSPGAKLGACLSLYLCYHLEGVWGCEFPVGQHPAWVTVTLWWVTILAPDWLVRSFCCITTPWCGSSCSAASSASLFWNRMHSVSLQITLWPPSVLTGFKRFAAVPLLWLHWPFLGNRLKKEDDVWGNKMYYFLWNNLTLWL